jgi:hypothetical protein
VKQVARALKIAECGMEYCVIVIMYNNNIKGDKISWTYA